MRDFEVTVETNSRATYKVKAESLEEAKNKARKLNNERTEDPEESSTNTYIYCKRFDVLQHN